LDILVEAALLFDKSDPKLLQQEPYSGSRNGFPANLGKETISCIYSCYLAPGSATIPNFQYRYGIDARIVRY